MPHFRNVSNTSDLLTILFAKAASHAEEVAMTADIARDHRMILEFFDILEAKNTRAVVYKTLYLKLLAASPLVGHLQPHREAAKLSLTGRPPTSAKFVLVWPSSSRFDIDRFSPTKLVIQEAQLLTILGHPFGRS